MDLRLYSLISQGLKTCGLTDPHEPYSYIEEELLVDEAEKVLNFFKWLFATGKPFGVKNCMQRWAEFEACDELPTDYYNLRYNIGSSNYRERLTENSLHDVAVAMSNCSQSNTYTNIRVEDHEGSVAQTYEQDKVFALLNANKQEFQTEYWKKRGL